MSLRGADHQVFFDRTDLPAGETYDVRILDAIEASDLFVFLISPESLEVGAYALTELGFARRKWRNPNRKVLPVLIRPVPLDSVPLYLRAVTVLQPRGDLPAEVTASVQSMASWRRLWRPAIAAGLAMLVVAGGIGIVYLSQQVEYSDCKRAAADAANAASRVLDLLTEASVAEELLAERIEAASSKPLQAWRTGSEVSSSQQLEWDREVMALNWQMHRLSTENNGRLRKLAEAAARNDEAFRQTCAAEPAADSSSWRQILGAEIVKRDDAEGLAVKLRAEAAEIAE